MEHHVLFSLRHGEEAYRYLVGLIVITYTNPVTISVYS